MSLHNPALESPPAVLPPPFAGLRVGAWWRRCAEAVNYWSIVPLKLHVKRLLHRGELELAFDRRDALRRAHFVVISTMRNEAFRMQYFLDYYRRMGFGHFIIIDNESDDNLHDIVRDVEDVTLYVARGSYKKSHYGIDWVNDVLARHAHGKWVLHADPDELLVFPHCDTDKIWDLTAQLEKAGNRALPTIMIDMYSTQPIEANVCRPGQDPLEVCDRFDSAGYVESIANPLSVKHIRGGPRARIYFDTVSAGPMLNKTPLVRWRRHYAFARSTNEVWPPGLADPAYAGRLGMAGALLHFKFLAEFLEKVEEEQERAQHTDEYTHYLQALKAQAGQRFMYEGSARFESWRSLQECGLISIAEHPETALLMMRMSGMS